MSYCGLQKSKGRASGTTVDAFKKKLNQLLAMGALHVVEEIQRTVCSLKKPGSLPQIWGIDKRFWGILGSSFFHAFLTHTN